MPRGRLEAIVTTPVAGWSATFTDPTNGATVVSIPGSLAYSPSEIVDNYINALAPGWTATYSYGESGTGLVTITCSHTPFSISWTSTNLRDFLGYAANSTNVSTAQVAPAMSRAVWMPDCSYWSPRSISVSGAAQSNVYVSDMRQVKSPTGLVSSIVGNTYQTLDGVRWDAISAARAVTTNSVYTTFEKWWLDTQIGQWSIMSVGNKFYFFGSADDVATPGIYQLVGLPTSALPQSVAGWTGRFRVVLPTIYRQ